jgi:hypothetical protein
MYRFIHQFNIKNNLISQRLAFHHQLQKQTGASVSKVTRFLKGRYKMGYLSCKFIKIFRFSYIWQVKTLIRKKPSKPDKSESHHTPGPCLNCGTYLWGNDLFCPNCGQKRLEREDMSFSRMIGESFLDYFHFDSKFFKTIIPLIFKPGRLTIEFMKGKRKTYVEPFRLFLVISIIYFLLLPLSHESKYDKNQVKTAGSSKSPQNASGSKVNKLTMRGMPVSQAGEDSMRREIDTIGINKYVDKRFGKENWAVKLLMRQTFKILVYSRESFSSVMEHTASKMIFLLIPLVALLLKLLYIRKKRLYYEHLIFSLHTHAFVFLILIVVVLIEFLIPVRMMIVTAICLVYLFFAIKKYYGEKKGRTLRKFILLILLYGIIALPIFYSLLMLVSLFIF